MSGRSRRSTRSNHHMGQKKKVHSLPPLEGKRRDSKQSLRTQSLGLGVGMPDRQRIIGSPAPQAYRQQIEKNRNKKGTNGPTITLSAAEDEDDDDEDEDFLIQRDSVLEVGSGKKTRNNSSLSLYSVASLGNAVEQSRASSGRRSGLSPPPRVISMMDAQGNHVTTEWNVPGMESIENLALDDEAKYRDEKHEKQAKREKDKIQRSKSGLGSLPNKYPTLEPISKQHR